MYEKNIFVAVGLLNSSFSWAQKSSLADSEAEKLTRDYHKKHMVFQKIKPGKFEMSTPYETYKIEITKPFYIMSTEVTQLQYATLMVEMGFYQI